MSVQILNQSFCVAMKTIRIIIVVRMFVPLHSMMPMNPLPSLLSVIVRLPHLLAAFVFNGIVNNTMTSSGHMTQAVSSRPTYVWNMVAAVPHIVPQMIQIVHTVIDGKGK